jgi:predicted nucleic acid-binding protein
MARSVLVDSSFFINRLRAGGDPLQELTAFSGEFDYATCGVVTVEVLRGMKHKNAHRRMANYLQCMRYVPTLNHLWESVERLTWELDRTGKIMQLTDLIIAASALDIEATLLTLDSDFLRVPKLRVIQRLNAFDS